MEYLPADYSAARCYKNYNTQKHIHYTQLKCLGPNPLWMVKPRPPSLGGKDKRSRSRSPGGALPVRDGIRFDLIMSSMDVKNYSIRLACPVKKLRVRTYVRWKLVTALSLSFLTAGQLSCNFMCRC